MTQEEAIKILRDVHDKALFSVRTALETLIPELRESEDERIRKGLIEALKTSKTVGELKFILPEPTREECIAYLEKQKEQKPEKWSKEDEAVLNAAIEMVDNSDTIFCFEINKYKVKNWLKSLPQRFSLSSWGEEIRDGFFGKFSHNPTKPSEEQMSVLWDAISNLKHDGYKHTEELISFYEQLKAL